MNSATGEICYFAKSAAITDPWIPISRAERRELEQMAPSDRPAVLAARRADPSKAKRRKIAAASRRRNR